MKNGPNFLNKALRCQSSRQYRTMLSPRTNINSSKKLFLNRTKYKASENKKQFIKLKMKSKENSSNHINNYKISKTGLLENDKKLLINKLGFNNRYDIKTNSSKQFSPSVVNYKNKVFESLGINKVNNNEKSLMINKSTFEYNAIVALLDKIMDKANSYDILIKIKNFIYKFINGANEKKYMVNSKSCAEIFQPENYYLTSKNMSQRKIKLDDSKNMEKQKETRDLDRDKKNNLNEKNDKNINNSYLTRRVKKLYNKINELETKSHIEQLKYLFFIVEQEKKIAELEKNFEINEIPLDERIIEKMKELKCYPTFIRNELDIKKYKQPFKETIDPKHNNSSLKSRNKQELKEKYSFDKEMKEIEPINKKNQSIIMNKSENVIKSRKFQFSKKKIDFNLNQVNQMNQSHINDLINKDNKIKKIEINFSKPVNIFFNNKNFFITHPKLNYVKDSLEKNHFLKLKTKEQLSGDTNLLSNMNLASKSQKNAVNDFSSFINNSMANFERIKK